MNEIKKIVSQEEIKEIDRVIEEIYSIDDQSNHSVAFQWGFGTVLNYNGSGYNNLVIIVNSLNSGGEDEAFARFILDQVLDNHKIEILKKELWNNRNRYISILYL